MTKSKTPSLTIWHCAVKVLFVVVTASYVLAGQTAIAEAYDMDPAHSFIQFKASHLGIGWVVGRFNSFRGEFTYSPADGPGAQTVRVIIETGSLDSAHPERDRHLTSDDFLDVATHPQASFVSTGYEGDADSGIISGMLTLWGQTAPVAIKVTLSGEGDDPWGGYRAGFEGTTTLNLPDFGFESSLVQTVDVNLYVEGVRR